MADPRQESEQRLGEGIGMGQHGKMAAAAQELELRPGDQIGKLALALLSSPRKVSQLIAFQRQTITAAKELGRVLNELFARPLVM